ncbi:MAG: TolC family protein, partial [Verrucomicrobiae bacterium]|nr:TolC family protein [Verrucomicrobiae bacterium]
MLIPGQAGDGDASIRWITLQDAVQMALKNNLKLEIESIDVDIQDTSIQDSLGDFDPTINLRAIYESIENPQNQREFTATNGSGTAGSRIFEEENVRLESSLDGKLPIGTEWSLVAESDRLKNTLNVVRPPSLYYPEYDTFFGLRLTQPLMKDFGVQTQMAKVHLAVSDRKLADIDWQRNLRETVAEIAKSYYDLIFAREDEDIKRRSIGLADELVKGNQKRLNEGVASAIEVRQAEVAVSVREEALISSQHFFRENQNLLIRQLYRDFDILNPPKLRPTGRLSIEVPTIDKEAFLASALSNRLEYKANVEQLAKQDIQIQFYKNQLLPRVDLVGTLGGNSLAGNFG